MEKLSKGDKWRLFGGTMGFILCVILLFYVSSLTKKQNAANVVSVQAAMKMVMEAGYVQGQADALKDTIRIRMINDSTAVWVSSPWGNIAPMNDTVNVNILHK